MWPESTSPREWSSTCAAITATWKSGAAGFSAAAVSAAVFAGVSVRPSTPDPIQSVAATMMTTARMRLKVMAVLSEDEEVGGNLTAPFKSAQMTAKTSLDLALRIEIGGDGAAHEEAVAELADD